MGKGVSLTGAGKKGKEEAFLSACGGQRPRFPVFLLSVVCDLVLLI